ncbi:extracellular alpha-1 4-glucan glucosidase [Fusarium tjaetaba]|uniref:Extracellular alpha-1 4-glucan glucosidase n=1 Tax=Fusarium tjaetaba TaxID=1567544 RepID=A0A8H5W3T5_9HYPO|nr:extracellular alpha-1 4-glucan glucosidase [Fusarium tjaetaba]KAF5644283.1 extracellular alpha-1 4-glucan glucosidase [Fusarium tjaetaba]
MRPPNIPLFTVLSVLLMLSCLLGSAAGLGPQQHRGARKDVRGNTFIEARNPLGNALADGYGPPPPYYTGEPVAPTDLTSHHTLEESTATETPTGASQASVTSKSNVSSHYDTVSSGSSSLSVSSALETDTAMITVGSSAKAGSTSGSEASSSVHLTASGSFLGTETSGAETSSISPGQVSTISGTNSSLTGTYPSADTSSPGTVTALPSGSTSSATVSGFFNETNAITESVSHTQTMSSAEASGDFTTTELTSRFESSVRKVGSTTTTTKMLNVTVTVAPSSLMSISSSLSSLNVPMTADETTTVTVIPQQNSSELSTGGLATDTDSAAHSTLGSLATESTKPVAIRSTLTEAAISESTQKSTLASSIPVNGTVSFTTSTTAYFTTTVGVPVSSSVLSSSSGISRPTIVASDDSSGAGTGDSSAIMASITVSFSTTVTTSKTYTALNVTSPATSSSFSSVPTFVTSASVGVSESNVATASNQMSSETLFASTALPINATSDSFTKSFVVTTVSEGSVITVFPGGIIPTESASSMMNNSVSTQYSTSAPSRFNSSMSIRRTSLSSQTDSWFDWPTSTLTTLHTSEATLEVPSLSFPSSWLSIITTAMTPPSVSTTSTRGPTDGSALGNVTVIKTTMTSTITSSLAPTSLSSSGNVTVAHTTSGYNFSKSVGSSKSAFSSQSTSLDSFSGISTVIISKQPTNFPFPTNTSLVRQSETSSMSLSESIKTTGPKGSDATFSVTTAGFNSTAPYTNSTTITASETYPSSNGDGSPSIITSGASASWNTTNSAQRFTNSTIQTAVTAAHTGSDLVSGTQTLSDTAAVTPQPPASLNVTLTTFTDVKATIIMPTFSTTSESNSRPTVSTSAAPFPLPSNATLTGTGASLPPSGTGPRITITGTLGDFSTSSVTISPSVGTTYHTANTTVAGTTTDTSTSASGTNEPLFPVSNSTSLGTISLSTIVSWRPDPEPWTSWPTLSLTNEPGISTWTVNSEVSEWTSDTRTTTKSLTPTSVEPSMSHSSAHNLSSATSGSTSYTRTTTVTLTATLEESSTSPSTSGNRSSAASESNSYTRTTTVFRTTTLGGPGASSSALNSSSSRDSLPTSYTRTTTLTLTTTLAEPPTSQISGAAVTDSSVSTWADVTSKVTDLTSTETISLATVTSSLSGTLTTFLTTGSAKGISTSLESSALAPIPVGNSTLSQASGRASSGIDTLTGTHLLTGSAGTATPCESTSTSSSTCTESVYDAPTHTAIPASTDCLTATNRPDLSLSYVSAVTATEDVSSTCNTTSSTVHWLNMTHTFGVKDTETSTYQPLTTLRTVTKAQTEEGSGSAGDDYPTPTDRSPEDPNFPWGNDSPIHRHQNSSELSPGENDGDGDGGLSKRSSWRLRWENVRDKLEGLWRGQALKSED